MSVPFCMSVCLCDWMHVWLCI